MAVYTRIEAHEAQALADRFGLGTVRSFDGIAKGSVNTNYRLVTVRGTFFVRLDERRTRAAVAAELRLLDHLRARGFPTPAPVRDAGGRGIARFRTGRPVSVFPWVPGADKEAHEYGLGDLSTAGAMLARLHIAGAGHRERIPNRFSMRAIARKWVTARTRARLPARHRREIEAAVALARKRPPPGRVGVVHGDWFCDNLLFEGSRITSVIDFEAAATEHLTFDVATAINALCWLPTEPDRFRSARVDALLHGYRRESGPAALDRDTLLWWLRASALRFTVTRVVDFRLRRSALRVEKDYRDFLHRLRWWSGNGMHS